MKTALETDAHFSDRERRLDQTQELMETDGRVHFPFLKSDIPKTSTLQDHVMALDMALLEAPRKVKQLFDAESEPKKDMFTMVTGSPGHFVTLAIQRDGTVAIINSLGGSSYLTENGKLKPTGEQIPNSSGLQLLEKLNNQKISDGNGGHIRFTVFARLSGSAKRRQQLPDLQLIECASNCENRKSRVLQRGHCSIRKRKLKNENLQTIGDRTKFGPPIEEGTHKSEKYFDFMRDFRQKTQSLNSRILSHCRNQTIAAGESGYRTCGSFWL